METDDGILLTVAEASCRYLYPARYDEEISVQTSVMEASKRLLRFDYKIVSADGDRVLAKGETTHVFCNRAMRPCQLPEKYREAFRERGQQPKEAEPRL
jgi:acyl-CoA thioester hydrolase